MTYAVILAGGVGSRFWPFSRELEPKQFMKLVGQESLLQSTVKRLKGVVPAANIFFVTNNMYYYELLNQIKGQNIPEDNIILEPEGKNTAPAIGLCARLICRRDKDAVLIVLPSDHYIKNLDKFKATIQNAVECAKKGLLVTIGIKPVKASTGYGYIEAKGKEQLVKRGVKYSEVERFHEKPSLEKAKEYIKNNNFFWNSGIFIWRAQTYLEEVKRYLPDLYRQLNKFSSKKDIQKVWPKIKPISVDYGIMERSKKIALIPASFFWTDLGSWEALSDIFPKDFNGNVLNGDVHNLDSHGVCIFSRGNRLISTIGVKDLVIADTPDALLVCDRNRTQDVKKSVEELKALKRRESLVHLTERRPWGSFTILQEGPGFKTKLIEINPGKRLSLQRHKRRAEHWVVVSGKAHITIGSHILTVDSNYSVYVPMGVKHRLENLTKGPVRIVEVQTGSYLGEDDIERFEDDFKQECRHSV